MNQQIPALTPMDVNDFEIWLGYSSPGEDFFGHLVENGHCVEEALKAWSADLSRQAALLERLSKHISGANIEPIHEADRPNFAHIAGCDEAGRQVLADAVRLGILTYSDYKQ